MQSVVTVFRYLLLAVCCLLWSCHGDPSAPASKSVYYQDYMVSSGPLGFKLAREIKPAEAISGQYYWRATYDDEGRITALEAYVPPTCLESRVVFSYEGKSKLPSARETRTVGTCSGAPIAPKK
jgi:hypothetical protein